MGFSDSVLLPASEPPGLLPALAYLFRLTQQWTRT